MEGASRDDIWRCAKVRAKKWVYKVPSIVFRCREDANYLKNILKNLSLLRCSMWWPLKMCKYQSQKVVCTGTGIVFRCREDANNSKIMLNHFHSQNHHLYPKIAYLEGQIELKVLKVVILTPKWSQFFKNYLQIHDRNKTYQ